MMIQRNWWMEVKCQKSHEHTHSWSVTCWSSYAPGNWAPLLIRIVGTSGIVMTRYPLSSRAIFRAINDELFPPHGPPVSTMQITLMLLPYKTVTIGLNRRWVNIITIPVDFLFSICNMMWDELWNAVMDKTDCTYCGFLFHVFHVFHVFVEVDKEWPNRKFCLPPFILVWGNKFKREKSPMFCLKSIGSKPDERVLCSLPLHLLSHSSPFPCKSGSELFNNEEMSS